MKRYISFIMIIVILLSATGCKKAPSADDEGYLPTPEVENNPTPQDNTEQDEKSPVDTTPSTDIKSLGEAVYPDMPEHYILSNTVDSYRNHSDYEDKIYNLETDKSGNAEFVSKTLLEFLKNKDGKNFVYSPTTLYFALCMLSECVDGNTQSEILDLIGKDDAESIKNNAHNLWQKLYVDDGISNSVSANSIWLTDGIEFNQQTIDTLKDSYYASSFSGSFANENYIQKLRDWINEQTGGLLKESVQKEQFDPSTVMSLVSTTYFKSGWDNKFGEDKTTEGTFHSTDGDKECNFMHKTENSSYYWSDKFSAIHKSLNEGYMSFILPDEDKSIDDLLRDTKFLEFVTGSYDNIDSKSVLVNMSVPKFDITADLDLVENLKSLGINDAFSETEADFSPLTTQIPLFINKVSHSTRVKIDEEGCEAASYVIGGMKGAGHGPTEEVDFVLDRPFIFVVSGQDNLPRFIGVVNMP